MKTTHYQTRRMLGVFSLVLSLAFLMSVLALPHLSEAKQPDKNHEPKGNAFGYYLKHLDRESFSERFDWLPPGIAKLFARGGGDDGGDGDEDTTDPTISNLSVDTGTSTVDFDLEFDESVKVSVYLSTNDGFAKGDAGVMTESENTLMSDHSLMFDGLTPDTEYFYRVQYRDEAGNTVLSAQMSFTTDALPGDTTNPTLTDLSVDTGTSTAEVMTTFDENVQLQLFVSTSSGFAKADDGVMTFTDVSYQTSHSFMLGDLEPDTEYFYRLEYRDLAGNTVLSDEMSMMTDALDIEAPVISGIVANAATTSVSLDWVTDEPSISGVYSATTTDFGLLDSGVTLTQNAMLLTNHSLMVTGLEASTTYYFRILAEDVAGNATTSAEFSLDTL